MYRCKYVLILLFGIMVNPIIFAQQTSLDEFKKNPRLEINIRQDSVIEVVDKSTGERYLKNISRSLGKANVKKADLILELDTVNYSYYEKLYRYWGKIEAWNAYSANYISIDANANDKFELYVYRLVNKPPAGPSTATQIYEQGNDFLFNLIYEYPGDSLSMFFDVGDITGDGLLDIFCRDYNNALWFFRQNKVDDLIIDENFIYKPFPPQYQPNTPTFYDIDGDSIQEIIYFLDAGDGDSSWAYSNHVAKYNPQINNYKLIYHHRPLPDFYTYGISTGDFDGDGKGNFATGSINGKFYIYEYVQGTQYKVELEDTLSTYNAYLTTFTDDMDGNGKPEIWIGGDFSSSIYGGVTRLFAFESNSPGNYELVYQIDIRGLFAYTIGKMRYADLDYNNRKELFLANGDFVFCIKSNSVRSYYFDFIKLLPLIDTTYSSQYIESVDAVDLDGDNIMEIVANHEFYFSNQTGSYCSVFYKRNNVTDVMEPPNPVPGSYDLAQNYPNPFNPVTNIKFSLPELSDIEIKVYNILGKEIKELLNETRSSGEHKTSWNGKDDYGNTVPSGVYFITMKANTVNSKAGCFQKTIKAVLLK
jgi:hypothetical protein